jgi:hypothetical protein
MKNGQRSVNRLIDSWASASEIGTGEDFTIALAISEVGSARRFLGETVAEFPAGAENNLKMK